MAVRKTMAIVRGTAGITVHRKRNELSAAVRRQERVVREGRISRLRDSGRYVSRKRSAGGNEDGGAVSPGIGRGRIHDAETAIRSEEHTSELQSHLNLVCRLLLEKKKK